METMKSISNKYYRLFQTPHGPGCFVYGKNPFRLKAIYLPLPDQDALFCRMKTDFSLDALQKEDAEPEAEAFEQDLSAYFFGQALSVEWEHLDMSGLTPLQQNVLRAVAAIPFGRVRSYGDIARAVGRPGAGRFVGNVMARNPFPILIPCHRVVRSDGSVGGFGGGPALKKAMLKMESDAVQDYDSCKMNRQAQNQSSG